MRAAHGEAEGDPAVEIRPCREDDLDAVSAIERGTFPLPWSRDQFADLLSHPAGFGWVATVDDRGVAGYAIGWIAADEAELADLAVAEGARGRGIGTELVRAFAREAGVRGARRLYLEVRVSNEGARRFYRRLGFDIVGRRAGYYRNPLEDAWAMGVDLPLG
ncbi:MAG TPA: ribosomal protein S18-alanine N-acetyltransferase [Gemmatimonadota bacterium]|jgi:ribosomal-protein-alanine N-acetyltransferase